MQSLRRSHHGAIGNVFYIQGAWGKARQHTMGGFREGEPVGVYYMAECANGGV